MKFLEARHVRAVQLHRVRKVAALKIYSLVLEVLANQRHLVGIAWISHDDPLYAPDSVILKICMVFDMSKGMTLWDIGGRAFADFAQPP